MFHRCRFARAAIRAWTGLCSAIATTDGGLGYALAVGSPGIAIWLFPEVIGSKAQHTATFV